MGVLIVSHVVAALHVLHACIDENGDSNVRGEKNKKTTKVKSSQDLLIILIILSFSHILSPPLSFSHLDDKASPSGSKGLNGIELTLLHPHGLASLHNGHGLTSVDSTHTSVQCTMRRKRRKNMGTDDNHDDDKYEMKCDMTCMDRCYVH